LERLPVAVVTVDGINPVDQPEAVYSGKYRLSRKVHLLTRQDPPAPAKQLADFFLSDEGQSVIKEAGYLPLPK
jgi:phosphate transport system substrate-binding protein